LTILFGTCRPLKNRVQEATLYALTLSIRTSVTSIIKSSNFYKIAKYLSYKDKLHGAQFIFVG